MADDAGPLLARAGLIENEQLLQARRAQASHGGTLGEHLVLAGFIDDEALTSFYRSRLMVPRVDPRQLEQIPPRVIARIPKDMAAEFRLVPVAVDREQNLVLAMSDPSNTHAVDEIGFFTGAYVVRAVANQREIAAALDRYYDIQTPLLARQQVVEPPAAAPAPDPASARRKVLPPMSEPPASSGRAVRISEIVPAVREAKEAEARALSSGRVQAQPEPATASPDARTMVPGEHLAPPAAAAHERRTELAEPLPRFDPEQDTRPIARAMDLLPPERVSNQQPVAASGEISGARTGPQQVERLDAVIVDQQLAQPSEAVLLTRKRDSEPPEASEGAPRAGEEEVVLLSKRKPTGARTRRPSATRQGIGVVGADAEAPEPARADEPVAHQEAPATAEASATTQQMEAVRGEPPASVAATTEADSTGRFERPQQVREHDEDWGEPGSTIPPEYIGASYDYDDASTRHSVPVAAALESAPRAVDTAADYDASVLRLAEALKTLDAAPTRDDVISALVGYMAAACRRAAFFAVSRGALRGWSARGYGVTTSDQAELSLDKPSTFQDIVATRLPFHGPVHDRRTRDFLMAAVGATPTDMTALPVCVREKVIGIVYGDERKQTLFDEHLNSLVRSAGAALERIVMARKGTRLGH